MKKKTVLLTLFKLFELKRNIVKRTVNSRSQKTTTYSVKQKHFFFYNNEKYQFKSIDCALSNKTVLFHYFK